MDSGHTVSSSGSDVSRSSATTDHVNPCTRDQDYYFGDGSVVLRTGRRLFKIHRSLFERDSPFFRTLFSLPQGAGEASVVEGQSDENPIICQDSPLDFQALCWAVYSRPSDILVQQNQEGIDVQKLIRVVALAHKYEFANYRDWALDALEAYSAINPRRLLSKSATASNAGRMLDLAKKCGRQALADRTEKQWLRAIFDLSKGGGVSGLEESLSVIEALDDLRCFHAQVYYAYLKAAGIFDAGASNNTVLDIASAGVIVDQPLLALNDTRRMRLCNGFWSLSQLRLRLSKPPKLADSTSCSSHARDCVPVWETWWKGVLDDAASIGQCLGDPGALIHEVQRKIAEPIRGRSGAVIPCDALIRSQVKQMARDYDSSLADRFMIP